MQTECSSETSFYFHWTSCKCWCCRACHRCRQKVRTNRLFTGSGLLVANAGAVGRATAHVVSRQILTVGARVRLQAKSCGICGGHSGTGVGFLRVLRFPMTVRISPTAPYSPVIRGWYSWPTSGRPGLQVGSVSPYPQHELKSEGPYH
jgi:hypothetical protein